MRKRPLRSPGLSDEEYWRWLGANSFRGDIGIEEYEGPISAQQRDWFYAGQKEEEKEALDDFWADDSPLEESDGESYDPATSKNPTLKVVPLLESNYRDIPATLRRIADQIEKGEEYGQINDCVLVIQGTTFEIFHTGKGDVETAHLILSCAQRKIEMAVVNHYE